MVDQDLAHPEPTLTDQVLQDKVIIAQTAIPQEMEGEAVALVVPEAETLEALDQLPAYPGLQLLMPQVGMLQVVTTERTG